MSKGWGVGLILASLKGGEESCAGAYGEASEAKSRGSWNLSPAAWTLTCRLRLRTAHVPMG